MDDLNDKRVKNYESSGKLLAPQEKLILEQIASGGPPHSQRAHSLLAIDTGVTHKIAALHSGQTVGQVSYWLGKFRREGMGIFPEELLRQAESELPPPRQLPGQLTPSAGSEIDQEFEQDSISPAAEAIPVEKEEAKVKSKQDKASKKVKKEKKSPADEAKSGKKAKKKKKSKSKSKSKKDKASKKKKGKKKPAKKSKKKKDKNKKNKKG